MPATARTADVGLTTNAQTPGCIALTHPSRFTNGTAVIRPLSQKNPA